MDKGRSRWEYKHLVLNFDVSSDEGWRQLQVAGGEGWEAVGLAAPNGSHPLVLLKRPLASGRKGS
jgi:hypothetical protein